ncbi:hypothetical protein P280DRAFT_554619 [Massarina eburnea CBS 473.64]|uniref:Uncharacterized protein n=1 Tax=Massarina eburnea CBS 473.64 TaxID=1395130 RepID=A0A6A6RK74_9PLEO|nr:hypothetical protein P280DRAFT_554619 [Massarina eburnea CBS 473.64]
MSLVDSYHVHLGFWTNWNHGKIEGATITLTRKNGGLLIAFIAIFVGAAGKSFWRLGCFLLHHILSNPTPQDGIYHQTQAILRNCDTAQDAAWSLLQVIWAWRVPVRFRKPFPRLFGIIIMALIVSVSFGVAGVFSSQITTDTANEVLLTGDNCGPLDVSDDNTDYNMLFLPHQQERATGYANYALQCYTRNSTAAAENCHPYAQTSLKTTIDRNSTCPFSKEMCKSQSKNLFIDTGYIDSNKDLGINAAPSDRFHYRFVHHCAPLVTEGFTNITQTNTSEMFQRYWYGSIDPRFNYTQEVSLNETISYNAIRNTRQRASADYGIQGVKSYGGSGDLARRASMFDPIPQLQRADADVMLFFLSSRGIMFTQEVDDPWFSAHKKGRQLRPVMDSESFKQLYDPDEPIGVVGCAMQMQICNANLTDKHCEPLRGMVDDSYPLDKLYQTQSQKTTLEWANLIFGLGFFSISGIVEALGVSSLVARHGLGNNAQGPLPDNQWQIEVEHWVAGSLASLQGSFVEAGNGPNPAYQQFRVAPNNTDQWKMCRNQKIMTTQYSSFSVLGIGLILVIGGLFIFLDLTLQYILDYTHKRRMKKHPNASGIYARLEWDANTTLQLQRLAHEHIGVGTWSSRWAHPITAPGEKLAMIDTRNNKHTTLITPHHWERDLETGDMEGNASTAGTGSALQNESGKVSFDWKVESPMSLKRENILASGERGVRRVDTKATLVNDEVSPITPVEGRRLSGEIGHAS